MSLRLAGLSWVTPFGIGLSEVWQKLLAGAAAGPILLDNSLGLKNCGACRVPVEALSAAARQPRLRRASAISRFAVVAGLGALQDAGVTLEEKSAARTALVFAVSNGGVIYTKRFFHEVVVAGAQAASPLLFPETVFNAPASHLAAILGITGRSYTVVGDGAVGVLALKMAEDLMATPELDRCLVVGAEEADWLLCDAYRKWRLLRSAPPIEPFRQPARGTILSEGAGAVLLAREGGIELEQVHSGRNFARQQELPNELESICRELKGAAGIDIAIASANGTFIDQAERSVYRRVFPDANVYAPKPALGEPVAAGAFWQLTCATLALREQRLPPLLQVPDNFDVPSERTAREKPWQRALITSCGMNQQVAALTLRLV